MLLILLAILYLRVRITSDELYQLSVYGSIKCDVIFKVYFIENKRCKGGGGMIGCPCSSVAI